MTIPRRLSISNCFLFTLIFSAFLALHLLLTGKFEEVRRYKMTLRELNLAAGYFANECQGISLNSSNLRQTLPNCSAILNGDLNESCHWVNFHRPLKSDAQMLAQFKNCRRFKSSRGYPSKPNSIDEEKFPLAFAILMHKGVEQTERLLRLIYAPQNLYCIHVDRKAQNVTHEAIRELASCFPNVIIISNPEYVYWAGYGVLRAVLRCLDAAVNADESWKYFLNIAAQDFPLKTNFEIVQILKLLGGANDVELNNELQFDRYWYNHRVVRDKDNIPVTHYPDYRKPKKLPVPGNLKIYKGNLASALSRPFANYLLKNDLAQNLTLWLNGTDTADEHLFSTLNHNAKAAAPGGYPGHCHPGPKPKRYISRYALWLDKTRPSRCRGKYVREVCVFGVRDLPRLGHLPHLFANKLYLDYQSVAYDCLEQQFLERIRLNSTSAINATYYRSMEAVKYHHFMKMSKIFGPHKKYEKDECPPFMTASRMAVGYLDAEMKQYVKGGAYSIITW